MCEKLVSERTFLPLTKKTSCRSALISMSPISPASSGSTAEQHQVSSTAAAALDEQQERKGSAGRQHRHYRTMHRRLLLLRLQNASCTLKNNATKVSFIRFPLSLFWFGCFPFEWPFAVFAFNCTTDGFVVSPRVNWFDWNRECAAQMFFFAGVSFLKGRAWGRSGNAFSTFSIAWDLQNLPMKFFCPFLALQHC